MPDPAPRRRSPKVPATHQLDEISQTIGELRAYVHEWRHGTNEVKQMIVASDVSSEKRHLTLKLELKAELKESNEAIRRDLASIDGRVAALETARHRQEGAIGAWKWLADHWPFAALAAFLSFLIAWANGKLPHL